MSTLVDRAIAAAGLDPLAAARRAGDVARARELAGGLEGVDLLVLGALADRVRAEEVGDVVRVFAGAPADDGPEVITLAASEDTPGQGRGDLLRRVAMARLAGPPAARVRVDWEGAGIELAQVALGFGASELAGPVLNRRGLPILEGSTKKVKGAGLVSSQAIKKDELATLVRMAGRVPVFDGGGPVAPREPGGSVDHA